MCRGVGLGGGGGGRLNIAVKDTHIQLIFCLVTFFVGYNIMTTKNEKVLKAKRQSRNVKKKKERKKEQKSETISNKQ